jgi:DNA processing protein
MPVEDRLYNIAISFLSGVGNINTKKLLTRFSDAKAIFNSSLSELKKIPGIGEHTAKKLFASFQTALTLAEEELEYMYSNEIDAVTFLDEEYPERLKECDDAPTILYYKGNIRFNEPKILSIVGTRKATRYGQDFCSCLIADLAKRYPDMVIVSGLAFGIDVTAHKEALKNNLKTWAILGHGLESIYPSKHKRIAQKITETDGAVISDYPHGSKIDPSNFVKRNRIIAGICDALIVVESGIKGGSIITANIANHYNRDVFAVPGNINSTYSAGCNKLIKTNRAHLIESIDDIEYIMNWSGNTNPVKQQIIDITSGLNENEITVVNVLKNYEFLDIDNITRQTNLSPNILSLCLLELEFKNIVKALPGKIFTLKVRN